MAASPASSTSRSISTSRRSGSRPPERTALSKNGGSDICRHSRCHVRTSSDIRDTEMNLPSLFSPLKVGPYQLGHRVVMAPLTRMRAERDSFAPRPLNAEYYGQRATQGGLLIAEASPVLSHGRGNPATPGIYSETQIAGWRKVVDAVHAKGGVIFLQLW